MYLYCVSAACEPGSFIRVFYAYENRLDADRKAAALRRPGSGLFDVDVSLKFFSDVDSSSMGD